MNASTLFDALIARYHMKDDAALCRKLGVQPPAIGNARRFGNLTDSMILRVHDTFGLSAAEIREMAKQ